MIHSKRSLEGELLIDNRVAGGSVMECATSTCKHCHRQVVLNPLRTRERGYCQKCDGYLCDQCELVRKMNGGDCRELNAVIDRLQNEAVLQIGKG